MQYKAVCSKKIPIAFVDHDLDKKIPFLPEFINIYLDFSPFWVKTAAFLQDTLPKDVAVSRTALFVRGIGDIYVKASAVYREHLSTTARPRYLKKFRFVVIHLFDPHLMCIPSIHVMLMIYAYSMARNIVRSGAYAAELRRGVAASILNAKHLEAKHLPVRGSPDVEEELRKIRVYALQISDSVLYVKQHSINCVAAAMYAMTALYPELFPPVEALEFAAEFFYHTKAVDHASAVELRNYVTERYLAWLIEKERSADWTAPLLEFVKAPITA
jgi:hypothetical protein